MTDATVESVASAAEAKPQRSLATVLDSLAGPARFIAAVFGALVVFGILIAIKGVNPVQAMSDMFTSTFSGVDSFGDIAIRTAPILLAALAVTVPARAGLINVGGEGQLIIGGIGAVWVSQTLDGALPGGITLILMGLGAMVAAGIWAGIAAALRSSVMISESVTTLLMNYIALDLMYFLIYEPWKNKQGSGQPATVPLSADERLPLLGDSRVHLGILIAVIATLVVWAAFTWTSWGFKLRVVGGNAEAARRAGMRVNLLTGGAMALGGALAGLGGFVQLAGAEFTLRPGFCLTYGYIGFLASWLARHKPIGVAIASFALSAIAISGDSLQLDSGLPAASVNVLMAVVILFVFGFGRRTTKSGVAVVSLVSEVLTGGVRGGTSILYAGLGESIGERSGVVNLGTEGSMLCGALAGYAVASETNNVWIGVLAGIVAGALLSLVHAYFVLSRGTNQLATGLVVLFLGLGLTSLFGASYVQALAPTLDRWAVPLLSDIPFIGPILFEQDPLVYISYALVPTVWWVVYRSRWGVILRAAGERSEVLTTHGYSVRRVQYIAVVIGGALSGMGGAELSLAYTKAWFENMVQGRGFVAVAVVMFAALNPGKIAAGAYLFGACLALSPALQARGYGVNQYMLHAMPYVITLLVLIVTGRRRATEIPEGLSKVFDTAPAS